MQIVDETVKETARQRLIALEDHFQSDVAFFSGSIDVGAIRFFRDFLERTASGSRFGRGRLVFFLQTSGGSAEAAEKMVDIIRYHYPEVFLVVPDFALSAGTILCMSGDRIYMDYSSSLGPIDPQVWNGKEWVPALGYLDKVEALLQKAAAGLLTNAEFLILQNQDLALLSAYEQARDLTVTLLKKWLVQYKFRNWTHHNTDPVKKGQDVTLAEKQQRAEEIARALGDHKHWHSHGRMIGPSTLTSELRLLINDYSSDSTLRPMVRSYSDLLTDYMVRAGFPMFMHSRDYF
ncbi:MAG: serine dehydrogenasease [Thermodesulfobacteriota bacterium]